MAARIVDSAFALVYLRLLGEAGTGAYQFLVVFTTYLDTLVDFGLNALVARDVPRAPGTAASVFRTVSVLRVGLWLAGLPMVWLVYGPGRDLAGLPPDAALAGWIFYLALLPTVLAKSATGLLWAFERLEIPAMVSVLSTILRTALGVVVLFLGLDLLGLASTSVVVNVVSSIVLVILMARMATPWARTHAPAGGESVTGEGPLHWLRESWPLFLNQLLQGLFFKIDALLLPRLAGTAAAGVYAAAYKVSEGAGLFSSSLTLALFPRLAREENNLSHTFRLTLRCLLQIAFPLSAGIAILATPAIALVAGRDYLPEAAVALTILIWYLPLSYANGLTQYVLIAAGRQRFLTLAFLAAFLFNIAANLALIPRYGFLGAAVVTVASEVVLLVPFTWAARRAAPGVSLWRESRHAILATALMAPVVWWLRDALHPLAAIVAGLLVYPAALWTLGGLDADQLRLLKRALSPAARALRLHHAAY